VLTPPRTRRGPAWSLPVAHTRAALPEKSPGAGGRLRPSLSRCLLQYMASQVEAVQVSCRLLKSGSARRPAAWRAGRLTHSLAPATPSCAARSSSSRLLEAAQCAGLSTMILKFATPPLKLVRHGARIYSLMRASALQPCANRCVLPLDRPCAARRALQLGEGSRVAASPEAGRPCQVPNATPRTPCAGPGRRRRR
jgi:hypothetical protein